MFMVLNLYIEYIHTYTNYLSKIHFFPFLRNIIRMGSSAGEKIPLPPINMYIHTFVNRHITIMFNVKKG